MSTIRTGITALALIAGTAACTGQDGETAPPATQESGTLTLAAALSDRDNLSTARSVLESTELAGVLDGPASYTLLLPTDEAFDALGEVGETLVEDEKQRPMLVGVLRDHMLPGHLTPEAIEDAIERNGRPVTMTTLGEAEVTFSLSGDAVEVSYGDSKGVSFAGSATATGNGVVIPIDAVLLPASSQ